MGELNKKMPQALPPAWKQSVSLINSTVDISTTLMDNLVPKIKALEMDESARNQSSLLSAIPYKFQEKISPDSTFVVKELSDNASVRDEISETRI